MFSIACYLGLSNAITIYYVSHFLSTKVELIVWALYTNNDFTW